MDDTEKDQKLFVRAFAGICCVEIENLKNSRCQSTVFPNFAEPTEIYRRVAEYRRKHVSFGIRWHFSKINLSRICSPFNSSSIEIYRTCGSENGVRRKGDAVRAVRSVRYR